MKNSTNTRKHTLVAGLLLASAITFPSITMPPVIAAETTQVQSEQFTQVHYKSIEVNGLNIAYREAGDPKNETILLLHGFPTSSQMFRNLIPELAHKYHVIAPDYPGYGSSDMPARDEFDYTFSNMADIVEDFTKLKNLDSYSLYLMDYGAPIGYRLFEKNPTKVNAFIIQNGNAYDEGLREFWDPIKAYWNNPSDKNRNALKNLLTIDATKWQYTHGVNNEETISPDTWHKDQYLLDRPGNKEIQLDMFLSYASNVEKYPRWQKLFRKHQPPTLIVWGKNDYIFPAEGAYPYKRDLNDVEFHLLDTGHFALEEYSDFIAETMIDFLDEKL